MTPCDGTISGDNRFPLPRRFLWCFINRLLHQWLGSVAAPGDLAIIFRPATRGYATLAVGSAAQASLQRSYALVADAQRYDCLGHLVERTGLANDAAFSVVLLDDTGTQLGISKTFNSDHQKRSHFSTYCMCWRTGKTFPVGDNITLPVKPTTADEVMFPFWSY